MAYLIIKFGSAARGDTNKNSDEDYTCIYNKKHPIDKLIKKYENITFISLDEISFMKKAGSLFITHLDTDGQKIEGDDHIFNDIKGFKPNKNCLLKSIKESSEFISKIEWFPSSPRGNLWLLDVLYVSFRNILYCKNASNYIYEFSLDSAMCCFGLTKEEKDTMMYIRDGKYAYRANNIKSFKISENNISNISSLAKTITESLVRLNESGITKWDKQWKYDYWDERLIERAIINKEIEDNGFHKKLMNHNYNKRSLPKDVRKYVIAAQQKGHLDI